jgi:hypothetical protein
MDPALASLRASLSEGVLLLDAGAPVSDTASANAAQVVAPVGPEHPAAADPRRWAKEARQLLAYAEGPAVIAWLPERAERQTDPSFAFVASMRAGTRTAELRQHLQKLEMGWTNFAKGCSPCLIAGTRGLRLEIPLPDWLVRPTGAVSLLPGWNRGNGSGSTVVLLAETNGVLAAASSSNSLAALLERVQGRSQDTLANTPSYREVRTAGADDAFLRAWLNLEPLVSGAYRLAEAADRATNANASIPLPSRAKLLEATGLTGLRSVSLCLQALPEGTRLEARLTVPQERRTGLIQAVALPPADAAPGAEVPGEVMRFERLRLDGRQAWQTLEQTVTGVFPQAASVLDLLFKTAGPGGQGSDLKADLLAALGNDLVMQEWAPPTNGPGAGARTQRLYRYASQRPQQLTRTLKALSVFLPPQFSDCRDENLGETAGFSLGLAPVDLNPATTFQPRLYIGPGSNFVAFATDRGLLAHTLTNGVAPAVRPLRERDGLAAAASRIGGMGTGWFGCVDLPKWIRWKLPTLAGETNVLGRVLEAEPTGLAGALLQPLLPPLSLDERSIPSSDSLCNHLDLAVYCGGTDPDGLFFRFFVSKPVAKP